MYNFGHHKIVAVKAQIHSRNFKTISQLHADGNSSFCLQGVYTFLLTPMQTLIKQKINDDPTLWPLCIKKSKIVLSASNIYIKKLNIIHMKLTRLSTKLWQYVQIYLNSSGLIRKIEQLNLSVYVHAYKVVHVW